MKFILLIFSLIYFNAYAQTYKVNYNQIINFSNDPDISNAYLTFNNNESSYVFGQDRNNQIKSQTPMTEENQNVKMKLGDKNGFIFYRKFSTNELISRELLFTKPVVIRETYIDSIKWKIINDSTKLISTYTCIKAEGIFGGRSYNVWFTNEIPVSAGPWKLNGLPGLILEAQDSEKVFTVNFLSLVVTDDPIVIPFGEVEMTRNEYVKTFKQKIQNLSKYLGSTTPKGEEYDTKVSSKFKVLEKSMFDN